MNCKPIYTGYEFTFTYSYVFKNHMNIHIYLSVIHIMPKLQFFCCTLAEVQHRFLTVGHTGLGTEEK